MLRKLNKANNDSIFLLHIYSNTVNPQANQCEALYIINGKIVAYHQNEVLYIIIAKENTAYC